MLKLIRADLYKIFHRPYFYVMAIFLAVLCIIVNIALRSSGQCAGRSFSLTFAISMLSMPVLLMPMLTDIVSAEEYRDHTLKNTLSFGTNRAALYLSKTMASILLGVILMVVVLAAYCVSSFVLLAKDANFTDKLVQEFLIRVAASCSVYIACIAMGVFVSILFRHGSLAIFLYYGVFYLPEYLFMLLRIPTLNNYLLKTQITRITQAPLTQLQTPVMISLISTLVFIAAGVAVFRNRDVC